MFIPEKNSHKGENGKLLIIAGSKQYHGSAVLAIQAAKRFVDLVYFYPGENDCYLINAVKNIPEVIVVYDLKILEKCDAVLFGPGLGDAKVDGKEIFEKAKKIIVDGDGFRKIRKEMLNEKFLLTPHEGEFEYFFGEKGRKENVKGMAKKYGCVILKKGPVDFVSDGKKVYEIKGGNAGLTKGGTGDVLAGFVSALATKNSLLESALIGAKVLKKAGELAFKKYGYWYSAGDVIEYLPEGLKTFTNIK
ncbi:MAG: NAD(P)H-hydrate dehydratase [Candidatus Anstonellales archaeon]